MIARRALLEQIIDHARDDFTPLVVSQFFWEHMKSDGLTDERDGKLYVGSTEVIVNNSLTERYGVSPAIHDLQRVKADNAQMLRELQGVSPPQIRPRLHLEPKEDIHAHIIKDGKKPMTAVQCLWKHFKKHYRVTHKLYGGG